MRVSHIQRATVDGVTLEYREAGAGDPVVLIHGVLVADAFHPLLDQPVLTDGYRLIAYRRRGYGGSTSAAGPLSIEQQAADCLALLRALEVDRAHVVGHSLGGCIALQLALDAPDAVRSLALLEPALAVGSTAESYRESLAAAIQRFGQMQTPRLVDEFMEARTPGYREPLDRALPGAFEQAVADAHPTFHVDMPGLLQWSFGEPEARRIAQPALSILGGDSDALWSRFGETHRLLLEWLPRGEGAVVPRTTHFLHAQEPAEVARALRSFLDRHLAV